MLASITEATVAGEANPIIKTYVSEYPSERDRCVIVTTFQNYLSDVFLRKMKQGTNDATYKMLKPGAFLRVASLIDDADKELAKTQCEFGSGELKVCPGAVFGQYINKLVVHEAAPEIAEHEADILKMTSFIYRIVDYINGDCLDLLRAQLILEGKESRDFSYDNDRETEPTFKGLKTFPYSEKFPMPIGFQVPVGDNTALISLLGRGAKTYGGYHSDTHNKHDTHDNSFAGNQALFMRILTHCGVFTPGDRECPPGPIVSLRHGLQEGRRRQLSYCLLLGNFDSETGAYQRVGREQAISLQGKSHAHLQFLGTQGGLMHEITPKENRDIVRSISSPRPLITLTPKLMLEKYGKHLSVDTSNNQRCRGTIEAMLGNGKVVFVGSEGSGLMKPNPKKPRKGKTLIKPWHDNAEMDACFNANRLPIQGIQSRITLEQIARSEQSARVFFEKKATVVLHRNGSKSNVSIGPETDLDENGRTILRRPGSKRSEISVAAELGIAVNSHGYNRVCNTERMDGIQVYDYSKNDPVGILRNLITLLTNDYQKDLLPVTVCGEGGSEMTAGQYVLSPSDPKSFRTGNTHYVATPQKTSGKLNREMAGMVETCQVVNLYYYGIYLGPYTAVEYKYSRKDKDDFRNDMTQTRKLIQQLNKIEPKLFPENDVDLDHCRRMSSAMAGRNNLTLNPLDRKFHALWMTEADEIPWKEIHLNKNDFALPSIAHSIPSTVEDYESENCICTANDVLEKCVPILGHLTENGRKKFGDEQEQGLEDENDMKQEEECFGTKIDMTKIRHISLKDWWNGCVHLHAHTLERLEGDCVKTDDNTKIRPPRGLCQRHGDLVEFARWMNEKNFKVLLTRPIHPPDLGIDVSAHGAAYDSHCYSTEALGAPCEGVTFFTDDRYESTAFDIFFVSLMWAIMMPSAIVDIKLSTPGKWETYVPYPKDMLEFREAAEEFAWSPHFLHPVFCNMFRDKDEFLAWISTFAKEGKPMVQNAIRRGNGDRKKTSRLLKANLKYIGERSFDDFQMQVIMRTVEHCCMEGPFGEIKHVISGYGGSCGSLCVLKGCMEYLQNDENKKYLLQERNVEGNKISFPVDASKTELSDRVPEWLVIIRNAETKRKLNSPCEQTRQRIELELQATNLQWSEDKDCLVHSIGLPRRYNANDTEHANCGIYGLLAQVRPERNVTKTGVDKKSYIDGPKYHPVRLSCESGKASRKSTKPPDANELKLNNPLVARQLEMNKPLLDQFKKIGKPAYKLLMLDEGYEHNCLSKEYNLDVTEQEVSALCSV